MLILGEVDMVAFDIFLESLFNLDDLHKNDFVHLKSIRTLFIAIGHLLLKPFLLPKGNSKATSRRGSGGRLKIP